MPQKFLRVGIIGCGNIGSKRARAILELGKDKVFGVYDTNQNKAKVLAQESGAKVFASWQEVLASKSIDAVVVATTTDVNVQITLEALKYKKHVLAEKPLGKNAKEALLIEKASRKSRRILKVGFNHRHHPAVFKAYQLVKHGRIGKVMYIEGTYGHGGRLGYDLDWRMQKKYAVGGELLDQGVHIIDLAHWFLGNIRLAFASTRNYFWKKSPFEDNAFCQLITQHNQIVNFHVSITQWRNRFQFEIFGTKGYVIVAGLGKSYGLETLTLGTEVGKGQVPKEQAWTFEGPDISWQEEWKEFRSAIIHRRKPLAGAADNLVVNRILESLYLSAKKAKIIKVK